MDATQPHSWIQRAVGAAKLDINIYEEVEADHTATGQAAGVVVVVALAEAIASAGHGASAAIGGVIGALLGWLIWAAITNLIGTRLFGGTADWGELLRTLGFAHAPGVFYVLGLIPGIGPFIAFAVAIWMLIAGIVGIRQALDFSTGKAVLTAVLGWLAIVIPLAILVGLLASHQPAAVPGGAAP
jgi:hypothetical protein